MSVMVTMSEEEVAKKWLHDNNMVAVRWNTMNDLIGIEDVRRKVVFDAQRCEYRSAENV